MPPQTDMTNEAFNTTKEVLIQLQSRLENIGVESEVVGNPYLDGNNCVFLTSQHVNIECYRNSDITIYPKAPISGTPMQLIKFTFTMQIVTAYGLSMTNYKK